MRIENDCTIHSCIIDDDAVIGAGSVIQQGSRIERGAVVEPNSIVRAGSMIPAGQVWGGQPCVYVRDLSEKEMMDNLARSFGQDNHEQGSLYPQEVVGEATHAEIADYNEEKYFKN